MQYHQFIHCTTLLTFVITAATIIGRGVESTVFQGHCSDSTVLCEHVCIPVPDEAYECACYGGYSLLQDGISCVANNSKIKISYSVKQKNLEIQRKSKALGFDGHSHLLFPSPESAYLETNITIEFKFDQSADGILLFAGSLKDNDFIAISIKNDSILLRFDCGEGTVEDLYRGPLEKNVWHSLHVFRKFCAQSEIQIDNRSSMTDDITELMHYKGITVDEGIFVGGATDKIVGLEEKAGTRSGFTGCVRRIVVNAIVLLNAQEGISLSKDKAKYCTIDVPRIQSDKTTKTSKEELEENNAERSDSNTLVDNAIKKKPNSSVISDGNEKKNKESINNVFQSKNVGFNGNSYVQLLAPEDIDRYMELKLSVKPKEADGIIYFDRASDRVLAIYLENSFVFVLFSIGSDKTLLRSEFQIPLNVWKKVEVWRSGRAILLKVADQMWIENRFSGKLSQNTITKTTYFGGAPLAVLPDDLKAVKGFVGCMRKVRQNARMLHLHRDALVSVNTHDCGWNPCFEINCGGESRCLNVHVLAVCLCRYPLYGNRCEYKNELEFSSKAMQFSGTSYLRFASREVMEHVMGETLNLRFTMKLHKSDNLTQANEQILVYAASSDINGDYMKLQLLKNKRLELLIDLGSGPAVVTHPTGIEDEAWHDVIILREARQISLIVDELEISTTAPGDFTELNVYDSLFIGGALDGDKLFDGFKGCIRDVFIDSASVTHPEHASEAINLSTCL